MGVAMTLAACSNHRFVTNPIDTNRFNIFSGHMRDDMHLLGDLLSATNIFGTTVYEKSIISKLGRSIPKDCSISIAWIAVTFQYPNLDPTIPKEPIFDVEDNVAWVRSGQKLLRSGPRKPEGVLITWLPDDELRHPCARIDALLAVSLPHEKRASVQLYQHTLNFYLKNNVWIEGKP